MRVVVAMSGGVDSSVVAGLLHEAGHEVIGVHMKLHDAPDGAAGHCCGVDDARDARRVADRLQIPFYVMDLREVFKTAVMDDLVSTWIAGGTPNPCVQCNGVLKFAVLLRRAIALGAESLATGHYARTDGQRLLMATDREKDQSYFLHNIRPEALRRTLFPLGGLRKSEVRAEAARMGLATAEKPESMEVCFLPDDDHTGFVAANATDVEAAGDIVDEAGRVLGRHDAYYRFTVGQRKGLGLGGGPWYVLSVDAGTRSVVVGPASRLSATGLVATGFRWLRRPSAGEELQVRLRHRGALIPCRVAGEEPFTLHFEAPTGVVAPGQSAVVYAGEEVLGGGAIRRGLRPGDVSKLLEGVA